MNSRFFAFFNFQNGVLQEGIWGGLRKIIFVSILHVISFCNYFKTTLTPNWLSLYLNFCSLSSTKPLLASVWISNFYSESQNHVLAMHIIAHFFPIFWKFPEAVITKGEQGKRRRGRRLEQRVEWRWMRSVGDQWCCGIRIKCFCFTLTVIFHVQVEVQVEFIYLSVDGAE